MIDTLRRGVEAGPFVLGDQFCAADVLLGMSIHFMRMFNMMEPDATLFAYADRCIARPAFARAMAIESGS